ncbi:MAG: PorT family protein [Paludibacteraceae bacterium]|nr:PorT family protein [Paludibacteraceae bacterium]
MRKILFFIFISLFCTVSAQKRNQFKQEIQVGINGGVNFGKISFLHNDKNANSRYLGTMSMRQGIKAGVSCRYIAQKHFGIQLEANYVEGGWKEKFRDVNYLNNGVNVEGLTIERSLGYLEIPLLAHIYFGNKFRYFFNMGPKFGYLLNVGDVQTNRPIDENTFQVGVLKDPRIEKDPSYHKADYGLSIGAGIEFPIWKTRTILEGRYTFGFGDICPNSKTELYQRSNNQMVAVTLAVMLPVYEFYK